MSKNSITSCIGETARAKNGLMMTIIGGTSLSDITVQFEDGVIVEHKYHNAFIRGKIKHPTIKAPNRVLEPRSDRIGETNTSYYGQKVTIVGYRSCEDIDVEFEDGVRVEHAKYVNFKSGRMKNPDFHKVCRVGETRKAKNGLMMTIIKYRTWHDLDVQFEDGVVVNTYYNTFCSGRVAHPTVKTDTHTYHTGETGIAVCGLKMEVIDYKDCYDSTIRFEDGYTVEHQRYHYFKKGLIKHPFPYKIGSVKMIKPAYRTNKDGGNFYCKCSKCGISDIMNFSEIRGHQCIT